MEAIQSQMAPAAIGTYSQAIRIGNWVYLSGQIPLDSTTMQLCSNEISKQIDQVFDNLAAVCNSAGGNLANIVKLTVYLINLDHFSLINEAMTRYFIAPCPARAIVGVSDLPRGAQLEVDGIMVLPTVEDK